MLKVLKAWLLICTLALPFNLSAQTNPNAVVEDVVRFYFADVPIMIDIARCESGFRQFNSDGSVLFDRSGTYVGIYQIAYALHTPKASSMALDLTTLDGNLGYARHLYNSSGTNPWKGCLPKSSQPQPTVVTAPVLGSITSNLRIGMSSSEILVLQKILNQNGFVIASAGPGSPGSETNYFGTLTREAVRKFQCAKEIVCEGSEATTGYGRVGPMTRNALNNIK
jgi:hypothetical protein